MQYIPSKKKTPSWMKMNDTARRHWMTSDVDMELTPADQVTAQFCRTDYFEYINGQYKPDKCDNFADSHPDLQLRSANCQRLTNQGNGGRAPYCSMSKDNNICNVSNLTVPRI